MSPLLAGLVVVEFAPVAGCSHLAVGLSVSAPCRFRPGPGLLSSGAVAFPDTRSGWAGGIHVPTKAGYTFPLGLDMSGVAKLDVSLPGRTLS